MVVCMRVCLGGTFFPLHEGHKALLRKAVQVAGPNGFVLIGVTSAVMAKKKGIYVSFRSRKQALERFLLNEHHQTKIEIISLSDAYGPVLVGDFDAIVVSPETRRIAKDINEKRRLQQKKPLQIIVVPFVLAEDNQPISSSRIRRKEITEDGTMVGKSRFK